MGGAWTTIGARLAVRSAVVALGHQRRQVDGAGASWPDGMAAIHPGQRLGGQRHGSSR